MRLEWDAHKSKVNRQKHKVAFETAAIAVEDQFSVTHTDASSADEEWRITTCAVEPGLILFVVHTHFERKGEEVIRIISARKAEPRERRLYEEAHKGSERRHQRASRRARRRH